MNFGKLVFDVFAYDASANNNVFIKNQIYMIKFNFFIQMGASNIIKNLDCRYC